MAKRTLAEWGRFFFIFGAVVNFLVTILGIFLPLLAAALLDMRLPELHYPFLMRIWSGMAFLWGLMFLEIASDISGRRRMIKYAWLEKSITAVSVTIAYSSGEVGWRVMTLIVLTDWIWIPIFLFFDLKYRGNPDPSNILADARHDLVPSGAQD